MKQFSIILLSLFALGIISCDEGGLKGTLKISITDAPIDASDVKSVNIVFTNVEVYKNGVWKSLRNFDQPVGVNLMAYSGGKSFALIDQYTDPGTFSALRLTMNVASRNSSLVVNPQSNIQFNNNSTLPLYLAEGETPQVILEKEVGISTRGTTDITLDFDLRKSVRLSGGEYLLNPTIRIVETAKTGSMEGLLVNSSAHHMVAFAYKQGQYQSSEIQSQEGISFRNAVTSATLSEDLLTLGFLEEGKYDLIVVKYNDSGEIDHVMGKQGSVEIKAGENTVVTIDLGNLSPA